MKTADFIREHSACHAGAEWALSVSPDMADVWDALVEQSKHDWLFWVATRPGVFPDSVMRKLACRFVRETPLHDERTVWNLLTDERSRNAIEVAELYADGKVTADELSDAHAVARAAAYAAASAAAYYDARAAYYAARAAVCDARAAVCAAALYDAACAAAAFYDARADARSAQVKMVAELGNPFKKGSDK